MTGCLTIEMRRQFQSESLPKSRMIGIGEVLLVEDTTGRLSQHVEGNIRRSVFLPID
jgi:hypothetical protein